MLLEEKGGLALLEEARAERFSAFGRSLLSAKSSVSLTEVGDLLVLTDAVVKG
jgi:hypothetical protein